MLDIHDTSLSEKYSEIINSHRQTSRQTDRQTDVTLAHPWAADILSRASTTAGSAALRRKEFKLSKYKEEKLPGGYSPSVVPPVF